MKTIYDLIGIGIGPFNLGLAALTETHTTLECLFFDQKEEFNWHINMILPGTRLQVPFYADLVTLADPSSGFTFLSYLKAKRRLFRFTIREGQFPLRMEYNDYCKWVLAQLKTTRLGYRCEDISYDTKSSCYRVKVVRTLSGRSYYYLAKRLVIGIGTSPKTPVTIDFDTNSLFHSEDYLKYRPFFRKNDSITIVGSGQSAAEIFNDLLDRKNSTANRIYWYTRSPRIFPMDYSKFTLEMTSPDYVDYFYGLSSASKAGTLKRQNGLYKGINSDLIDAIYDKLYENAIEAGGSKNIFIGTNTSLTALKRSNGKILCHFSHNETDTSFAHDTDRLILATGYTYQIPGFLKNIKKQINWDNKGRYNVNRNYSIDNKNSIFVQNAELHSHGFNTPDLGMGPYRNAIILNSILGYKYFDIEDQVAFQNFDPPSDKPGQTIID